VGLSIYDFIAHKRQHQFFPQPEFFKMARYIDQKGLVGGFCFVDAQVDDARLVLRLINEAVQMGGRALNYTTVSRVLRDGDGRVIGIEAKDTETSQVKTLATRVVINATGAWAETLHPSPRANLHLRPLRGSHLVFSAGDLPIDQAISFIHPSDGRAVFAIPWEGVVIVGTTDLDHDTDLSKEPSISEEEVSYLMEGLTSLFPSFDISIKNIISTFTGVRPVLSKGKLAPSEESRDHVVWEDQGLVTITGGKLTTFRLLAHDALKVSRPYLPPVEFSDPDEPVFLPLPQFPEEPGDLSEDVWHHLYGRYGESAAEIIRMAAPEDLAAVPGTRTLWAELSYTAKHEHVRHLSDLLLRRVRIGLLTPRGGRAYLGRIKKLCGPVLPWSRRRWRQEIKAYNDLWKTAHTIPAKMTRELYERQPPSITEFREFFKFYVRKIFST
jgi:glycerol-3-phosphate dehydrogenase